MSSRRARSAPAAASRTIDAGPPSARVAWSYVASLAAAVATALLIVITNAVVAPAACRAASGSDFGDCKLAWLIWVALIGFVVCLLPAALALRLGGWMWAAGTAGLGLLIATNNYDQAWWWVLAALLPAAAALLSADWDRGGGLRWAQRGLIAVLCLASVIAVVWWFLNG